MGSKSSEVSRGVDRRETKRRYTLDSGDVFPRDGRRNVAAASPAASVSMIFVK